MSLNLSLFFGYHHGLPRNKIEGAKAKCKALGGEPCQAVGIIYIIYIWLEFIYWYTAQLFKFCFPIPKDSTVAHPNSNPGIRQWQEKWIRWRRGVLGHDEGDGKENGIYVIWRNASTGEGGHTLNFLSVHFIGTWWILQVYFILQLCNCEKLKYIGEISSDPRQGHRWAQRWLRWPHVCHAGSGQDQGWQSKGHEACTPSAPKQGCAGTWVGKWAILFLHGIVAFSVWRVWKLRWKWAEPNTGTSHLFQHLCLTDPRCLEKNHGVADFQNRKASKFDSGVGNEIQWPSCHRVGTPAGNVTNFFKWLMKTRCHFRNSTTKNLPAHISAEVHHLLADTGAKGRWYIWQVPGSLGQRWSWRILDGYVSQSKSLIFRPNHRALQHFHTFMALRFWWSLQNTVPFLCSKVPPWSGSPDQAINLCVHSLYQMAISQESPSICHDISNLLSLVGPGVLQPRAWRWRSGPILVQSIVGFDSKGQRWPVYYFRKVKLPGCFI